MEAVASLRDVGVRFRMWRRNRPGHHGRRRDQQWRLWGIRHVDLDLQPGEFVGLIGPNGAGKTTLLKTMARVYRPDEGDLRLRGRVVSLLSPTSGLLPRLNGWENLELSAILVGLSRDEARARLPAMAEFSGLDRFLQAPIRTYSAGMKARLSFSVAALCGPDALLIDELVAVGDETYRTQSRAKLTELTEQGCTVVQASHDLERLSSVATRVVWLDHGEVVESGPPDAVVARYLASRDSSIAPRQ